MAEQSEISTEDIIYILENTWEKSRGEWKVANPEERMETLSFLQNRLTQTKKDGVARIWRTDEGMPIAVLGAYISGPERYETFLICSEHMEEHSIRLSFDMRKMLKDLALKYKGHRCGQYAILDRQDQISWFRFLGFKYKPEGNRGNMKYFEFEAPT